jgi:hypothetical protein
MESIYSLLVAWLMSSTALGVGSSTLAISSFVVALLDGTIDQSERRMLGVIYWSLRSAMVMIGVSLGLLQLLYPGTIASAPYLWLLLAVLVGNSVLMTKHLIPHTIGPALQAATWYTYGFMLAIEAFELLPIDGRTFSLLFLADIIILLVIVNALLYWMKHRTIG